MRIVGLGRDRLGVVLPPVAGQDLRRLDRELVRVLNKGYPNAWSLRTGENEIWDREEPGLIPIYTAMFEFHRGNDVDGLVQLRLAVERARSPVVKAQAASFLMNVLYHSAVREVLSGSEEGYRKYATECRQASESALKGYEEYPWSVGVTHVAHTALGVLGYHEDQRIAALSHLRQAVEEYKVAAKVHFTNETEDVGMAHLYLGHISRDRHDYLDGEGMYSKALQSVAPSFRAVTAFHLGATILDRGGSARSARKVLNAALRQVAGHRGEFVNSVMFQIARAEAQLGRKQAVVQLLTRILEDCTDEQLARVCRKWLDSSSNP